MKRKILNCALLLLLLLMQPVCLCKSNTYLNLDGLRDPFIVPEGFEELGEEDEDLIKRLPFDIEVKGIVMDKNGKFAIINDKIVKEKEDWKGLTIDQIERDCLTIIYGGKKMKIPFKKEVMQK